MYFIVYTHNGVVIKLVDAVSLELGNLGCFPVIIIISRLKQYYALIVIHSIIQLTEWY